MVGDSSRAETYDGLSAIELSSRLGVPSVFVFDTVASTMDAAHAQGSAGAEAGTLVLAERQTAGRGRNGRRWSSPPRGIWLTVIERPSDVAALEVLSLRVGLAAARALDQFAPEPLRLKWPNDLYIDANKVAGTLVEARWRGDRPEWVAIGFGVNMALPGDQPGAASLEPGTGRLDVLSALVPDIRAAAATSGPLTAAEMDEYSGRDMARGRFCSEPRRGRVLGIAPTGELLIELADSVVRVRAGSLVLD